MKKPLLLGLLIGCAGVLPAQQDPVLMRIDGREVLRSEFEYVYRHAQSREKKVLALQADSFALFKLKVAAAEGAGMDKQPGFRQELADYRLCLAKRYLLGGADAAMSTSCQVCDSSRVQVWVSHLFLKLPQTIIASRLRVAEARMDSIYRVLHADPQADFSRLVAQFSDDKEVRCINRLQTTEEFAQVAFDMPVGEISKPFFTPQGIHILKVLKREDVSSLPGEGGAAASPRYGVDQAVQAAVEKLKQVYGFSTDAAGVQELMKAGKTHRPLFSLDGQAYTGKDFERFSAGYPQGVKKQYEAFVTKTVLDVANNRMEHTYPDFRLALAGRCDSLLVDEITCRELHADRPVSDAELATYFAEHKSDYKWREPRFRGVVLHCVDKKTGSIAKKILKKFPEEEWSEVIRKAFHTPTGELVQVEQGLFTQGSNPYVDKLVFKTGRFEPVASHPYTLTVGKKEKAPDSWKEVQEQLQTDYRNYLDRKWMDRLRAQSKVEINEEVLNSVNNH